MGSTLGRKLNFLYLDESRIRATAKDVINHHSIVISWGTQKKEFFGNTETVREAVREWADSSLQLRKGQRDAISKILMYDYDFIVVDDSDGHQKSVPEPKFVDIFEEIENHAHEFEDLDKTERESIVKSRLGQGLFRKRLIEKWSKCSVTSFEDCSILKASHIKPWRASSNYERLDPYNGLLLLPNLDSLFDYGFITFEDNGLIRIAPQFKKQDLALLNVNNGLRLRKVFHENKKYLQYHREEIFQ